MRHKLNGMNGGTHGTFGNLVSQEEDSGRATTDLALLEAGRGKKRISWHEQRCMVGKRVYSFPSQLNSAGEAP